MNDRILSDMWNYAKCGAFGLRHPQHSNARLNHIWYHTEVLYPLVDEAPWTWRRPLEYRGARYAA